MTLDYKLCTHRIQLAGSFFGTSCILNFRCPWMEKNGVISTASFGESNYSVLHWNQLHNEFLSLLSSFESTSLANSFFHPNSWVGQLSTSALAKEDILNHKSCYWQKIPNNINVIECYVCNAILQSYIK